MREVRVATHRASDKVSTSRALSEGALKRRVTHDEAIEQRHISVSTDQVMLGIVAHITHTVILILSRQPV
jgi:hypothetical protein